MTHLPLLTRWYPLVRRVVRGDPRAFALVMTFVLVESGGRQYAVSRSGCAGLLQFCATTALRLPYARYFDVSALRSCRCHDRRCRVSRPLRRFLETTPPELHPLAADEFPCAFDDPRFDPESSLAAGWQYIRGLADVFEDNIYLVYIGYNSGPHVAERIWRRIGRRRAASLHHIARVLPGALRPNFKRRAYRRARALARVHLPKVAALHSAFVKVAAQYGKLKISQ